MGISGNILIDMIYKLNKSEDNKNYLEYLELSRGLGIGERTLLEKGINAIKKLKGITLRSCQCTGALQLYKGNIIDMKTGEGKTLVTTLATVMFTLKGQTIVITSNEYLAERDYLESKPILDYLGITCSLVTDDDTLEDKKLSYKSSVIYTTSSVLIFDYLRNLKVQDIDDYIEFKFQNVIIDEVDYTLLDEGSVPHILSGDSKHGDSEILYRLSDKVNMMKCGIHFKKVKNSYAVTKAGLKIIGKDIDKTKDLTHPDNALHYRYIINALDVKMNLIRGKDYEVIDNRVVLIDSNTGRLKPSVRLSYGKHQSLEAKEGVPILGDSQIDLEITVQSFYNMFDNLTGLSGTIYEGKEEIKDIYGVNVVKINTNKKVIRKRLPDVLTYDKETKYNKIIESVIELSSEGYPILVVMGSDLEAELINKRLNSSGVKNKLITSLNHREEAEQVAIAGESGRVTISTIMLGRGTDIKLLEKVAKKLGLYVICGERFNTSRVDEQIEGRSGRQGDKGTVIFYSSLEDTRLEEPLKTLKTNMKRLNLTDLTDMKIVTSLLEKTQTLCTKSLQEQRKTLYEYSRITDNFRREYEDLRYKILSKTLTESELYKLIFDMSDFIFKREKRVKEVKDIFNIKKIKCNVIDTTNYNRLLDNTLKKNISLELSLLHSELPNLDGEMTKLLLTEIDSYYSKIFGYSEMCKEFGLNNDTSNKLTYYRDMTNKIEILRFNIQSTLLGYLCNI